MLHRVAHGASGYPRFKKFCSDVVVVVVVVEVVQILSSFLHANQSQNADVCLTEV